MNKYQITSRVWNVFYFWNWSLKILEDRIYFANFTQMQICVLFLLSDVKILDTLIILHKKCDCQLHLLSIHPALFIFIAFVSTWYIDVCIFTAYLLWDFLLFHSKAQYLKQCLKNSECSLNICWMFECCHSYFY